MGYNVGCHFAKCHFTGCCGAKHFETFSPFPKFEEEKKTEVKVHEPA
jgi:hypothetical protein